jgi:hypothetical protein
LLAERIVLDWSSTAPSMRKALNVASMEANVRMCEASRRPRTLFNTMVDGQTFNMEWPAMHEQVQGPMIGP